MAKRQTGSASTTDLQEGVRSRFHPLWVLTVALALCSIALLAVSLILLKANRSFSAAWQHARKAAAADSTRNAVAAAEPIVFPASSSGQETRGTAKITLRATPSRLVELRLETPAGAPASRRWTVLITGPRGEALREASLPELSAASGAPYVHAYLDTEVFEPGTYRVSLSPENLANTDPAKQWSFTVAP